MEWMAWTTPVALFFIIIATTLAAMTIWEIVSPTKERKGFLPIVTTRGDRLFIGLLSSAYINIAWVGLTELNQWFAVGISLICMAIIGRWG